LAVARRRWRDGNDRHFWLVIAIAFFVFFLLDKR
jgi:hypothetical protein